jgi:pimeloyl-ACP methyl ester carboxylesterase
MDVAVPGGHIHATEQGGGPLVILIHGFPDSARTWRHQLPALAQAGYRAVAIDVRGYGRSLAPDAVEAYRMVAHVADVGAVTLGERAAVIGHDWGSPIAAACAVMRPDLFTHVGLLGVPYTPRPPEPPRFPPDFYVGHFQTDAAQAEIEADIPGFLERFTGTADSELVAVFERTGFRGPLNRYRNFQRDWEDMAAFDGVPIAQPALYIAGTNDPSVQWLGDAIARHPFPSHLLEGGHWIHQERPVEVNALLRGLLASCPAGGRAAARASDRRR